MRITENKCPWCGRDIEKPSFYRGRCGHCSKTYESFLFLYNRDRFTGRSNSRSEMSLPVYYLIILLPLAFLVKYSFRAFQSSFGSGIISLVICVLYVYLAYMRHVHVYLKKVEKSGEQDAQENSGEREQKNNGDRAQGDSHEEADVRGRDDIAPVVVRKVFLSDDLSCGFYHTEMEIEMFHPEDGSSKGRQAVVFHMTENLDILMEVPENAPLIFKQPGIPFKLYDREGIWVNHGITLELAGDHPDLFQVQLSLPSEAGKLSRDVYYTAIVRMGEEKELFYAVLDCRDGLESLKTGKEVYEVRLYHQDQVQKKLAIPADLRLYHEDRTLVCNGMVTYYFAKRYLFEYPG